MIFFKSRHNSCVCRLKDSSAHVFIIFYKKKKNFWKKQWFCNFFFFTVNKFVHGKEIFLDSLYTWEATWSTFSTLINNWYTYFALWQSWGRRVPWMGKPPVVQSVGWPWGMGRWTPTLRWRWIVWRELSGT